MYETRAFAPLYNKQTSGAQSTIVDSVTVTGAATNAFSTILPGVGNNSVNQFRVTNKTSAWAHVNFGKFGAMPAATVAHPGIAPGGVEVFTVDQEVTGAAVICDAAPASATAVIFTRGAGL